jgi:hypothetical protein
MTTTLTLRSVKGSELTHNEVDGNFTALRDTADAAGITLATEQATTSGTEKDFTSIPATVKRITVMFDGVSGPVTQSPFIIQIGDSGGLETTGYLGCVSKGTTNSFPTTGFGVTGTPTNASTYHGNVVLTLQDASNTWTSAGVVGASATDSAHVSGGSKQLSATLDRVRFTTVNGTDAFDAGSVNISYES